MLYILSVSTACILRNHPFACERHVDAEISLSGSADYEHACIGLQDISAASFALYAVAGLRQRRVDPVKPIVLAEEELLCIARLTLRAVDERHLMKDDVALEILSNEACARVDAELLQGTEDELDMLDTFRDPDFPCHRQALEFCQAWTGYSGIHVGGLWVNPGFEGFFYKWTWRTGDRNGVRSGSFTSQHCVHFFFVFFLYFVCTLLQYLGSRWRHATFWQKAPCPNV